MDSRSEPSGGSGTSAILRVSVRKFNTEGPMVPERHYCIPPLSRVDLEELLELVEDMRYFVFHAPRQTGKTSTLLALADKLNATGTVRCLYVNFEPGQTAREDVPEAMRVLLGQIAEEAEAVLGDEFVSRTMLDLLAKHGGHGALNVALSRWSRARKEPLVLLIDEIDVLLGDSLISVLRQLRAGYPKRPRGFPHSIILCGVRDPRDYRIFSTSLGKNVTWGSAFNIKAKSLRLGDLTHDEVRSLLGQHTAETGQEFAPGVLDRIWHLTQGQPWLVNALALLACFEDKAGRDRSRPIGLAAVDQAKENLILNRVTHLDQIAIQLGDERVRRVILPMIAGSDDARYTPRDLEYVRDLGLVAATGPVRMANPIYAEVVPRELTLTQQSVLESLISPTWYVRKDGSLNLPKLLNRFKAISARALNRGWSATDTAKPRPTWCCSPICTAWSTAADASLGSTPSPAGEATCSSNGRGPVARCTPIPASTSSSARWSANAPDWSASSARACSRRSRTWTCAVRSQHTWWSSTCAPRSLGRIGYSSGARSRAKRRSPCGACEPNCGPQMREDRRCWLQVRPSWLVSL